MRVHTCCACALECSALRACIKKDLVHGIEIRIQQQRVSTCTGCMLSRELACMHTAAKVLPNRVSRLRQCSLTTSCVIKLACVENAWGWERRFEGVDARGVLEGGARVVAADWESQKKVLLKPWVRQFVAPVARPVSSRRVGGWWGLGNGGCWGWGGVDLCL